MPNLAKALDIRSQSLYNYVANREEMVSLTGARLMQQMYQQVVDGIIGLSGSKAYLKFADIVRDFYWPMLLYQRSCTMPSVFNRLGNVSRNQANDQAGRSSR